MADIYRELVAILRKNGCYLVRPRSTKSPHTANDVLKQAGLAKAF
jgi:Holliday junction resolvase